MLDVLNFIFQDFWHWLGTLIMLSVVFRCGLINIGNVNESEKNPAAKDTTP